MSIDWSCRLLWTRPIIAALLFLTTASSVFSQYAASAVRIFNGHNLDGWVNAAGQPVTEGWQVEGGVLHRASRGGDLFYAHEVGDFELCFQWKIAVKGNSGLKYRVKHYGNQWLGCEYQLQDDAGTGPSRHTTGALYDVFQPQTEQVPYAAEQWHVSRIVVCGNHIEHWLNGVQVLDVQVGSEDWQTHVAKSKFRPHEGFGENRVGRLFLQDHGTEVWFRDIVLTHLSCSAPSPSSVPMGALSDSGQTSCPSQPCCREPRLPSCRLRGVLGIRRMCR